jgi:hypothetical protein
MSSSAAVAYVFNCNGENAQFDVYPAQHLEQLYGGTAATGFMYIVPAVDSFITFSASWDYAWPNATLGSTALHLTIIDVQTEEFLADARDTGGNTGLDPPFGELAGQGSAVLQANRVYDLGYTVFIDNFNPTPPGTYGEGSGEIHFAITPIPEPATAALIAIIPFLARPRRR